MSASPQSPSRPSASGLPATPWAARKQVLILSGPFAQHVATVTARHNYGRMTVVVEYGHTPNSTGKVLHLGNQEYCSTDSPTCPALPRRG